MACESGMVIEEARGKQRSFVLMAKFEATWILKWARTARKEHIL
jgi:hypothetical protein